MIKIKQYSYVQLHNDIRDKKLSSNTRFCDVDEVDAKVKKLKTRINDAEGDNSLQLFLYEQFIIEISQR